ncbi:MAG: hypothetical protein Q8R74_09580, partial [Methylophilus sp.]|nr:hypothetical protein [Methylophilus sp.]
LGFLHFFLAHEFVHFQFVRQCFKQGVNLITSGHFYLGETGHYYFGLTVFLSYLVPSRLSRGFFSNAVALLPQRMKWVFRIRLPLAERTRDLAFLYLSMAASYADVPPSFCRA